MASSVRDVDKHDGGAISMLRKRLEGEFLTLTGEPFPIFQDVRDIGWVRTGGRPSKKRSTKSSC